MTKDDWQEPVAWMQFVDVIYSKRYAYKFYLNWLEGHDENNCASMTVVFNPYDEIWKSTFWHGNRGFEIGRFKELEDAKQSCLNRLNEIYKALYIHPHQWQGLNDDEIEKVFESIEISTTHRKIYRAIEQALRSKNT